MDRKKITSKSESKKRTPKKSSAGKHDFLVVGLGASAGGVKALQEFFGAMPPDSGMAFVVILHLSREHESNLSGIIQTRTTMPVKVVNETHRVEPNNVYVIPPNRQLEMADGVIHSTDLNAGRGERVAIDIFFRTLAKAYNKNSVCIVMSGTGTDGTLGLKAVKEANGFAIVQDPEDAEHDSMPRSAIATALVDWILPVSDMPERLLKFRDSSERLHLTTDDGDGKIAQEILADESLREILTVLRIRTGHDFSNYKTPTLVRRIARHLQVHDLPDIPAYLEFLREKPEEIQSLQKNLLINVTNFFRDKEAWSTLQREVVPNLFANKKSNETIRVWSCGCASGEEAYTLAMVLTEHAEKLPDPPKIQVFATDVDEDAIAEARAHRYPQSIEADVTPERLKRFFVREGKYYRVKKELREMVLFAPHNVLRDPPFSRLDLVACRNLLIYLNRDTQTRVMEIFHFALASYGYLFLGSSETAETVPTLFAAVNKKLRFYNRRPFVLAPQPTPQMPVTGRWEVRLPEILAGKTRTRPFSLGEIHYKLLESFAPPSALVDQNFEIQYMSDSAGRYLKFRGGEPSNNLLNLVNPDLLTDLRAALFTVQKEKRPIDFPNVNVFLEGEETTVNLIVRPVGIDSETSDYLLVLFDETDRIILPPEPRTGKFPRRTAKDEAMQTVVMRLEDELNRTKSNLRSTIEQHEVSVEELKASNEELQAINEELRSTTEELETSKEELQSVNEELTTVNQELKVNIEETRRANSDLQNLMDSTNIATIFLDRNLCIKRFTPPVERIFNITVADAGRLLEHFTHRLDYKNLSRDAEKVLKELTPLEREVRDDRNRTFLARFVPYRTLDDRIDGVILNFIDITERKRAEEALRESRELLGKEIEDATQLQKISTLLIEEDEDALYAQILDAAVGMMRADMGCLQMLDPERQELRIIASKGFHPDSVASWETITGVIASGYGSALRNGERLIVPDVNSAEFLKGTDSLKHYIQNGIAALLTTPLIARDGRIVGMITTFWREQHAAGERELRMFDVLARQAADVLERRRTREALRLSEEKYRSLLTSIDEGFCTIEVLFDASGKAVDYRFLETNPAFARQTGIENSVGRTIREFAPQHEEFWFRIYGQIAKTGEAMRFQHAAAKLNPPRFYDVFAFRVGAPGENRVAVLFNDKTEHERAEESLHHSEKRMRIAIDAARLATWEWDLTSNLFFWNERHFRILGMQPRSKPVAPETFFRRVHPDHRARLTKDLQKAIKNKTVFDSEFCVIRTDGATRWMSGYGQITEFGASGKPAKMSGVMFDITDRKEAEEALSQREEQLRLILESTKDYAIITYDLKGRITRWNAGAERIFGYTEKEALGETTHLIFTPEDVENRVPEKEMASTLKNGRAEDERWHMRKDGSRFFASGMMQLLKDRELEGYVKICRDQTAKIEAEQAAQEKEMLRRLVSAQEDERRRIARDIHDQFGQQITALRLKLDAIKKNASDNPEVSQQVDEAQKTAADLDAAVDFIAWELRPAALDDLGLRTALANYVKEWSKHSGVETEFHADGMGRARLGYEIETNLYRIAQEALNNILKHAKANRVSVLVEKRGKQVILIIEDDGVGFNPKSKMNRQKGIGLIGMEERAKICGGSLEIESSKGKGTTVFARLPVKKSELRVRR